MTTGDKIEQIKKEQLELSNAMISLYEEYGWEIDISASDVKAKTEDGYTMTIEDGTCPDIIGALTHIYASGGCVFEGRVETLQEVDLLMKMLGFEKIK